MTTTRTRRVVVAAAVAGLVVVPADAPADERVAAPAKATWYRVSPTCSLPVGCIKSVPSVAPYPEGTVHVGVAGGAEESRTYIQLDLGSLPPGASFTGGHVRLPVDPAPEAGTVAVDEADVLACLGHEPVEDHDPTAASMPEDELPPIDCGTSSPAVRDAQAFVIDLTPFAEAWSADRTTTVIALLAAHRARQGAETWHVAFSGPDRSGDGVLPMEATLAYTTVARDDGDDGIAGSNEAGGGTVADDGLAPLLTLPTPPPAALYPSDVLADDSQVPAASRRLIRVEGTPGYQYAIVWLLPLALLIVGGVLGRSLT